MRRGFTLIELMIAVVLTGLLVNGALVAYRGLGERQKVKQAGMSFQTDLKSYQQKAAAGEKPAVCTDTDRLIGYRVKRINTVSYSVTADCEVADPLGVTVNLPAGVNFKVGVSFDLFFPVLSGAVTGATTITLENGAYSYLVTIESSGVIRGEVGQ